MDDKDKNVIDPPLEIMPVMAPKKKRPAKKKSGHADQTRLQASLIR